MSAHQLDDDIIALAKAAGLDRALREFPEDVAAAAGDALGRRGGFTPTDDPKRRTLAADAAGDRPMTEALHWREATALAREIAAGRLSPVTLMEALLARIAALDPALNVFIRLDREAALAASHMAEHEAHAGRRRGPLHGLPIAIKDIIDVAGLPTTCHSRLQLDHVAQQDAAVVTRLRAAGAIVVGKVATHEFAIGGPSFDLPFPPARNPWNREHHPGGSSSGSGAGVAAGMFPLALGTDTGGSVRNPASCCGIVGMKPTYGLVSRRGVFPLAFTLDHVGPMTRSVADNALLLQAMAGHDAQDPGSAAAPARDYAARLGHGVAGLRIGYVRHFHETDLPADPQVAAALDDAATLLRREGATIRDVRLPALGEFAAVNRTILNGEAFAIHAKWLREDPGAYGRLARRRLMAGAFLSAGDYVQAQRRRGQLITAVQEALREVDVLLCASSMDPPCRIDDLPTVERTYPRQARTPFNVTGHPALAMMSGLSRERLPLSLQLVGRYFEETTVYQVAAAYERATNWREVRAIT